MARIPPETIDQIREANDIVEVVSDYVQLKRSGQNFFGLCPFHQEKTPSFSVNPARQIFHCFGCNRGGNVFHFIMEIEGLDFPAAVKLLAERASIPLQLTKVSGTSQDERALLFNVQEKAARLYENKLLSQEGAAARRYLEKRGFQEKTWKHFRVGYAPDKWDFLTLELGRMGLPRKVLENSGLLVPREGGGFYDRFRQRLMFPIYGLQGRVIGFGGRTLAAGESAKYLNSPETPIYHKSEVLYDLQHTKDFIRQTKSAILVEGYLDLMRLFQEGFQNVVAGSGTAFTPRQARLLARFADRVWVCYDQDAAGIKAAERAGFLLLDAGLEVKVVKLPNGDDPDSFFNEHTKVEFQELLSQAEELVPFLVQAHGEELIGTAAKSRFLQQLIQTIAQLNNPLIKQLLIQQIAEATQVAETTLGQLLQRATPRTATRKGPTAGIVTKMQRGSEKAEHELLRLHLSENQEVLDWLLTTLDDNFLHELTHTELFQFLRGRLRKEFPLRREALLDEIENIELRNFLAGLIAEAETLPAEAELRLAADCYRTLKREKIRQELESLRRQLKEAEKQGKDVEKLLRAIQKLKSQQMKLK